MGAKLTPQDTGFSLVELVVVVAVLSVLAVGASLVAVSRDREPADIHVLHQTFDRARSAAVHSRQTQGLRLKSGGITAFVRADGTWAARGTERRWRGRVRVATDLPQQEGDGPNVVLLADGSVTGFSVDFPGGVRCVQDSFVGLKCE